MVPKTVLIGFSGKEEMARGHPLMLRALTAILRFS